MVVGHLERVEDRQAGWKGRSAEVSDTGGKECYEPPLGNGGGRGGLENAHPHPAPPRQGLLTEVFNGLDVIVADIESIQFLQRF